MVDDQRLDAGFAALADPTRRAILREIAAGARPMHALSAGEGISKQALSKHVATLARAGLIRRARRGREVWCVPAPEALAEAEAWLAETRGFWTARLSELARLAEEED